jgi:hypothetical protein
MGIAGLRQSRKTKWNISNRLDNKRGYGGLPCGAAWCFYRTVRNFFAIKFHHFYDVLSLETIFNLDIAMSGVDDRHAFAHKIALDLFQYMNSFSQSGQSGMMLVPTGIFDKWMERFDRKYRLDPNFMMKKSV